MATVNDILDSLEERAPAHLAQSWDNIGLLVGNPEQKVAGILTALDPTEKVLKEALCLGYNTIVTHHPVIFKPLPTINTGTSEGRFLQNALRNDVALIACHTNFDSAPNGVSDVLAKALGLTNLQPLVFEKNQSERTGLGRIGTYSTPLEAAGFFKRLLHTLHLDGVHITHRLPRKIRMVAVCGGSGSEFAKIAFQRGADVYLTAEVKHSTAIWANDNNFCIIEGTHYATEKPAVALLTEALQHASDTRGWNVLITQSRDERHPFVYTNQPEITAVKEDSIE